MSEKIRGFGGWLVKTFVKGYGDNCNDPKVRGRCGVLAGIVGICCNTLLCIAKILIGFISGSLAITADGVNNLSDAASSIMTLLCFHISQKPPDDEHPYGHARVEYLSGLAVAALILIVGFQLAKESVGKIIDPSPVAFSWILVSVLVISILVKLWMAVFNRRLGKSIGSSALQATAADSRNDVISTGAVLAAALISHFAKIELDGYMGLAVAIFIICSGISIGKETIKPLLGAPPDPELVKMVGEETLNFDPKVLGYHDLVVHDYGPGQCFASIHAELDHKLDPLEAHELLDNIEKMFREKHHIHMVIHYDPIVTDDAELNHMKEFVSQKLLTIDERLQIHDFRMVRGSEHTNLIFDIVLPHDMHGQEKAITNKINQMVQQENMRYYTVITFDYAGVNQLPQTHSAKTKKIKRQK